MVKSGFSARKAHCSSPLGLTGLTHEASGTTFHIREETMNHSNETQQKAGPLIAVALIPTRDRSELLARRSLVSVAGQSRPPDIVVVVDDSSPTRRHLVVRAVRQFAAEHPSVAIQYMPNARNRGASGAWNTGIFWAADRYPKDRTIVALLDDDDAWEPNHLSLAVDMFCSSNCDVAATGMRRIERKGHPGTEQAPPELLRAADFLVGNPHIQGSNLLVSLRALVGIGGFDEGLQSCTDRDLVLRLIDGEYTRYRAINESTVRHHAEPGRARLSTPGSRSKHQGLDSFWHKHRDRMNPEVRAAFMERNERLFSWQPPEECAASAWLVVGIIADSGDRRVAPLLDQLLALASRAPVTGLDVLILENGPTYHWDKDGLRELVAEARGRGLRIWLVPVEKQEELARNGAFGAPFERGDVRLGIAVTRSMLQAFLYALARRRPGCFVWILDDDKRIDALLTPGKADDLVRTLVELRGDDVDVALGLDADAAPLPVLTMLRGELVDLKSNLDFLASLAPDEVVPDRSVENARVRRRCPTLYHDLATDDRRHREMPLWWIPSSPGQTACQAFAEIAAKASGFLNGRPLFRSIPASSNGLPEALAVPSTFRGGSAWILDIEVLADQPNLAAYFDGDPCRRSDMLWALCAQRVFGRRVVQVPVFVRHDRSEEGVSEPWKDLLRDVRGHALYRAFEDLLEQRETSEDSSPLDFGAGDLAFLSERFQLYMRRRISEFETSAARVRSLAGSVLRTLDEGEDGGASWWGTTRECAEPVARLRKAVDAVLHLVTTENTRQWLSNARATESAPVERFLTDLPEALRCWQEALRERDSLLGVLEPERIANAVAGARVMADAKGEISLLGLGREGVVVKDSAHVYKWFDAWQLRQRPQQREFVRGLVGRLDEAKALPALDMLKESAGHVVLRYPYEPSLPYGGGNGPGLWALLCEFRDRGVVCNNLHPKNLRIIGDRIVLVDIGADLLPWSPDGWKAMVRRAWLSWRWWFRLDLEALMTRSLHEPDLPELEGVERLLEVLDAPSPVSQERGHLVRTLQAAGARTVLDYGCGKGNLVAELTSAGVEAIGYDPDMTLQSRWTKIRKQNQQAIFGGSQLLRGLRADERTFDAVVCSNVLCTLDDGAEYEAVLDDLRSLVESDGVVLVGICNPFSTFGGTTPFKVRPGVPDKEYDDTFVWYGRSGLNGEQRRDVHRPLRVVERDLARHGLSARSLWQSETVDLERFEPASDFIVLELEPCPKPTAVTLAIKTCVMDWRTLEEQVRHLGRQLEGPELLAERLLIVDVRTTGFSREHDQGDFEAFEEVIARLLHFSLVDRVVHCPSDAAQLRALNRRWFDLDSSATHAENGNPVAATLTMFEETRTPWLIQVDSDLMIIRPEPRTPVISKLVDLLAQDSDAVTVSLPITNTGPEGPSAGGPHGPWRVEVRGALLHLPRLKALLPLPNGQGADGLLTTAWHRSLDQVVVSSEARSLRVALPHFGFVHPPNSRKETRDEWMAIIDRCEAGQLPIDQVGQVDLCTPTAAWLGPQRTEDVVVILQGKDVAPGRMMRAIESLQRQKFMDWGAILMDDGSCPLSAEFLRLVETGLGKRWTVVRTPIRRGGMANLVWAVRHICSNPDSIIVLLDSDDSFIGNSVLDVVLSAHHSGADMTVGSMLRTDKEIEYKVEFGGARKLRGGGAVWQHLRTFRKRLFDAVPDEAFRLDGKYVPLAQDWAFMLPMSELARSPKEIRDKLYLYEPWGEGKGASWEWRETVIGRIVAKPALVGSPVDRSEEVRNA
jgi:glycosyltransferase involved in cell wall biosynthesis/SAM-dependent methyltransferase